MTGVTGAPPNLDKRDPYHHGDLRHALVEAAIELAREGGPPAIVLREVARRVGVSPNAAYRHFDGLPELLEAVSVAGLTALARFMEAELSAHAPSEDPRQDALDRLMAVGRGYVHFALAEPGLFAAAFSHQKDGLEPGIAVGDGGLSAADLLVASLDRLIEVGSLVPEELDAAATTAWAGVHGLATLLLGPLSGVAPQDRDPMIDASLELIGRGIISPSLTL